MSAEGADSARYRQVLGHFPTGVCVLAAMSDNAPVGMAIGSFFSISLDPPLVGFCIATASFTWPKIRAAGAYCISILADDQEGVSRVFASKAADKFQGVGWERSPFGAPRISDALAWIDCRIDAVHQAGDHDIVVGAVQGLGVAREALPLVFFRGGYGV